MACDARRKTALWCVMGMHPFSNIIYILKYLLPEEAKNDDEAIKVLLTTSKPGKYRNWKLTATLLNLTLVAAEENAENLCIAFSELGIPDRELDDTLEAFIVGLMEGLKNEPVN